MIGSVYMAFAVLVDSQHSPWLLDITQLHFGTQVVQDHLTIRTF